MGKIAVTHQQGNQLLGLVSLAGFGCPEKLGDDVDFSGLQVSVDDDIMELRKVLKHYSELLKRERKNAFGKASNWRPKDIVDPVSGKHVEEGLTMIDPQLHVEMVLSDGAESGMYHTLLLVAHPKSPFKGGVNLLEELVYPLIGKLERSIMFSKDMGLAKANRRQVKRDDDKSWSKADRKVLETRRPVISEKVEEEAPPPAAAPTPAMASAGK